MRAFALGAGTATLLATGLFVLGALTRLIVLAPEETCFLGYPNSDNPMVFQLTGKDAWDVCDNQTNPIRQVPTLQGAQVLAANTWAPTQVCKFDQYGLTWTIWWTDKSPVPDAVRSDCGSV